MAAVADAALGPADRRRQRLHRRVRRGSPGDHGALVVPAGRRGYGAACHAGLQAAGSEVVAFMDADASLDPADLALLLRRRARALDLLLGRRVAVGRGAWPWHLRLANRAGDPAAASPYRPVV